MVTLTFDESAAKHVIESFDWEVDDNGWIVDKGEKVKSIGASDVHISEFAGVVDYHGKPTPIRDDFTELIDWAKYDTEAKP